MDTLQKWCWVKGPPREALSQKADLKEEEKVHSERFTDQYISTNETAHRIIRSPHKARTNETTITEEGHRRSPAPPTPRLSPVGTHSASASCP